MSEELNKFCYTYILEFINQLKELLDTCNNLEKKKKPIPKGSILFDSIYNNLKIAKT